MYYGLLVVACIIPYHHNKIQHLFIYLWLALFVTNGITATVMTQSIWNFHKMMVAITRCVVFGDNRPNGRKIMKFLVFNAYFTEKI